MCAGGGAPAREPRAAGLGALAALPDELLVALLEGLEDPAALAALAATSRLLRVLAAEEPLWLRLHLQRCRLPFTYRGSWRATCLAHLPAAGASELTAADLRPPAPVPGFTSDLLYRCSPHLPPWWPGCLGCWAGQGVGQRGHPPRFGVRNNRASGDGVVCAVPHARPPPPRL